MLGSLVVLGYLKRQYFRFAKYFHFLCSKFDFSRHKIGIDGFITARCYLPGKTYRRFNTPPLKLLIKITFGVDYYLCQTVMVAKIDEYYAAMIAHTVYP